MTYLETLESHRDTVKANYERKLAAAPDICAAQAEIDLFRSEHAELKRRREAEFVALQKSASELVKAELELAKAEKAVLRALRESEVRRTNEEKLLGRVEVKSAQLAQEKAMFEAQKKADKEEGDRLRAWHQAERRAAQQKLKEKHDN